MTSSKQLSEEELAVLVDYFKLLVELDIKQRINRDE